MKELDTDLMITISYFGVNEQQKKLQEEIFELQEAIYNLENSTLDTYEKCLDHFKRELADVHNLLRQFQLEYAIEDEELMIDRVNKSNRTLKRIKEGYYKKG